MIAYALGVAPSYYSQATDDFVRYIHYGKLVRASYDCFVIFMMLTYG